MKSSHKSTHHIQEELQFQLPKRIHYEWKQLVRNEIVTRKEQEQITEENLDEQVILYGTTILGMGFFSRIYALLSTGRW